MALKRIKELTATPQSVADIEEWMNELMPLVRDLIADLETLAACSEVKCVCHDLRDLCG